MEYDSERVKCPYYIENNSKYQRATNQIRCEGCDTVNVICMMFKNKRTQLSHKRTFCYSLDNYHSCPVCKVLDERWANK